MSGSLREISFLRSSMMRLSMMSGYMKPPPHSTAMPTNSSIPLKPIISRSGIHTITDTRPSSFITRILSTLRFGGLPACTSFCATASP